MHHVQQQAMHNVQLFFLFSFSSTETHCRSTRVQTYCQVVLQQKVQLLIKDVPPQCRSSSFIQETSHFIKKKKKGGAIERNESKKRSDKRKTLNLRRCS